MLVNFEFLTQALSMLLARSFTAFSSMGIFDKFEVSKLLMNAVTSLMNTSSTLSLIIVLLHILMFSSMIRIVTVKCTWSDEKCQSR